MQEAEESIGSSGGRVVAVTMGTVAQAADFRRRFGLKFPCLADPERRAYRAYRIPRGGIRQVAGPQVWSAGLRALLRGGAGMPTGDLRQLQATFVVAPGGGLRMVHYSSSSADEPPLDQLLTAITGATKKDDLV